MSALSPISSLPFTSSAATSQSGKLHAMDTNSGSSTSGTSGFDATNLGSTFLSLLGEELQNQDPTQPMDATQEVGQMISLNQLDQLISINDVLSTATGVSSTSGSGSNASSHKLNADLASSSSSSSTAADDLNQQASKLAATGVYSSTQPLDLGTLMSLYGGK